MRGTMPGSRAEVNKRSTNTYIVKIMAITRIAYPALYVENLWRRFLATKVQKIIAGTNISNIDTVSDLASGPNISLPLHKKILLPFQA